MQARIQTALRQLETTHGIRILYACESGSRAWGFPSPGSDYDVRFIYCHAPDWYLTLDEGRDTLDFPVEAALDLAGWDLRKALRLLRSSNAALCEWLQSPVVYHEALAFRAHLAPLLPAAFNPKAGLHHYLGQLRRGVEEDLVGEKVRLKRLFYALRAGLAARWIREQRTLPPMEFAPLRVGLPDSLQSMADELLRQKASADEKTTTTRPAALVEFLQQEWALGQGAREGAPVPRAGTLSPELDALFRHFLHAAASWPPAPAAPTFAP